MLEKDNGGWGVNAKKNELSKFALSGYKLRRQFSQNDGVDVCIIVCTSLPFYYTILDGYCVYERVVTRIGV